MLLWLLSLLALAGLGGRWSESLDLLNSAAPITLGTLLVLLLIARPRGATLLIGLAGALAAAWQVVPELVRPLPRAIGREGPPLRLLSLNVWVRNTDPAATLAAIRAARADIVLLQETDGATGLLLGTLGDVYPFRTRCPGLCGLSILSRRPIVASGWRLRAGGRPFGPPLIWATTRAPDGRLVTAITLHYDWPLPGHGQPQHRAAIAAALARIDRETLLLGGDMNLTPWSMAMRRQDAALAPMMRHTRAFASWPARFPGTSAFPLPILPIDQIYAGPAWRQSSIERLPRLGSDHYGVLVTLVRDRPPVRTGNPPR